jgi:hypothetical protein
LKWTSAPGGTVVGRQNKLTAFAAVREAEDGQSLPRPSSALVSVIGRKAAAPLARQFMTHNGRLLASIDALQKSVGSHKQDLRHGEAQKENAPRT